MRKMRRGLWLPGCKPLHCPKIDTQLDREDAIAFFREAIQALEEIGHDGPSVTDIQTEN